jgi:hypothetical protein
VLTARSVFSEARCDAMFWDQQTLEQTRASKITSGNLPIATLEESVSPGPHAERTTAIDPISFPAARDKFC